MLAAGGKLFAFQVTELTRRHIQRLGQPRTSGIEHIDRLVRQSPPGQVTRRKLGSRAQSAVAHQYTMGIFVGITQASQNRQRLVHAGLGQRHRLKAP